MSSAQSGIPFQDLVSRVKFVNEQTAGIRKAEGEFRGLDRVGRTALGNLERQARSTDVAIGKMTRGMSAANIGMSVLVRTASATGNAPLLQAAVYADLAADVALLAGRFKAMETITKAVGGALALAGAVLTGPIGIAAGIVVVSGLVAAFATDWLTLGGAARKAEADIKALDATLRKLQETRDAARMTKLQAAGTEETGLVREIAVAAGFMTAREAAIQELRGKFGERTEDIVNLQQAVATLRDLRTELGQESPVVQPGFGITTRPADQFRFGRATPGTIIGQQQEQERRQTKSLEAIEEIVRDTARRLFEDLNLGMLLSTPNGAAP